jgi:CRP-like cAMP-binding protein
MLSWGGERLPKPNTSCKIEGESLKIAAEPLKVEFNRNTEMRDVLLKYTQAYLAQISQNVGCNRLHETDQRFARWLLEVSDRVESDEFPLTHEFMAEMSGVRRASVSEAAEHLKTKRVIEYNRGKIKIIDLKRLEKLSCECYQALKNEYDRLLP